jgi:hypothetical protein
MAATDSRGCQRQPKGVRAGGASNCVGNAELCGRGALKGCYRLAKDKLLRLKHMIEGLEQFLVKGLVLPLQVQHWNRHGHGHRLWLCR